MSDTSAEVPEAKAGRIPGEAGVWILIFGEMTFFAALFASFLYNRNFDVAGFHAGQAELSKFVGVTNTLLLLASSLFVARGVDAARRGEIRAAPRQFALGVVCALAFILFKAIEYFALFARGIAIDSHAFFGYYFGLTALHLGHVVIGTILLGVLAAATRNPLAKPTHFAMMESVGCFWHMVDLLWIVIFALLYLVE